MSDRNLSILVIADVSDVEVRESISQINRMPRLSSNTVVTPQFVKNTLADMPSNAHIGFLLWATDLQGLAADVESFASYLANENNVQGALKELGIEVNTYGAD